MVGRNTMWISLLILVVCWGHTQGQNACNFGSDPGCKFPCRCVGGATCDELTGQCPDDPCLANLPDDFPSGAPEAGWKGPGCQTGNAAYNKPAWQYRQYQNWSADRSVDGVVDRQHCSHPVGPGLAWWTVDLGALYTVYRVTVANTARPGWEYMRNLRVFVSNSSLPKHVVKDDAVVLNSEDDIQSYGDFATCGDFDGVVRQGNDAKVTCGQPLVGRYVLVWKYQSDGQAAGSIIPCEVTVTGHRYSACDGCETDCNHVYGCIADCPAGKNQTTFCVQDCTDGYYGVNCRHACSPACRSSCRSVDGKCNGGCQDWWIGDTCDREIGAVAPTDLSLAESATTTDSVSLRWSQLSGVAQGLESHYGYVIMLLGPTNQWEDAAWVNYTETDPVKYTLGGLRNNTQYLVRLEAYRQARPMVERVNVSGVVNVTTLADEDPPVDSTTVGADVTTLTVDSGSPGGVGEGGVGMLGVALGVTAAVIVIIIVIVVMVIWRRRRRDGRPTKLENNDNPSAVYNIPHDPGEPAPVTHEKKRAPVKAPSPPTDPRPPPPRHPQRPAADPCLTEDEDEEEEDIVPLPAKSGLDAVYANAAFVREETPLDLLPEVYVELTREEEGFKRLYDSIPLTDLAPNNIGIKPDNIHKNRFKNIVAYDHTRVTLQNSDGDGYINASYIKGFKGVEKRYVATQGPRPETIADFWQMMWQLKSRVIVMLTPLSENGKRKCSQYWPDEVNGSEVYGAVAVTLRESESFADYTRRLFTVKTSEGKERSVQHFQYLTWPDKQQPSCTISLLAFLWRVRTYSDGLSVAAPLVVHCSAGVGRTGTFIAVDSLLREAEAEGHVNIPQCVRVLREQRTRMVQTLPQYVFLYEAVMDHHNAGRTGLSCDTFKETFTDLTKKRRDGSSKLKEQFKVLRELISSQPPPVLTSAMAAENRHKNRFPDILPDEGYRPYLSLLAKKGNDYINAVFVKGFQQDSAFLVTQAPLSATIVDFWRLVHDFGCTTIVMLDGKQDQRDLDAPCYWPSSGKVKHGPVVITAVQQSSHAHWTTREFDVKAEQRKSKAVRVRQYHLATWEDGRPGNETLNAILELYETAMAHGQRNAPNPVLVHCMDGVSRCGVFCALDHMIGGMKAYREVDAMLAVRLIAASRREFVRDMDQYLTLHDLAMQYISKFDTYANFR